MLRGETLYFYLCLISIFKKILNDFKHLSKLHFSEQFFYYTLNWIFNLAESINFIVTNGLYAMSLFIPIISNLNNCQILLKTEEKLIKLNSYWSAIAFLHFTMLNFFLSRNVKTAHSPNRYYELLLEKRITAQLFNLKKKTSQGVELVSYVCKFLKGLISQHSFKSEMSFFFSKHTAYHPIIRWLSTGIYQTN